MDQAFWLARWEEGATQFHRAEPNPTLIAHAAEVFAPGGRVLVPLCGATHDLRWLADQGWHAIGVELSPIACDQLVAREGLVPAEPVGPFACWEGERITLLCGDFFALTSAHVGPLVGIWDRAALVAMHPDQRVAYTRVEQELLGEGVLLLNTLTYDQALLDGPPWSTDAQTVAELWPGARLLTSSGMAPASPRFAEQGVQTMEDLVFTARSRPRG